MSVSTPLVNRPKGNPVKGLQAIRMTGEFGLGYKFVAENTHLVRTETHNAVLLTTDVNGVPGISMGTRRIGMTLCDLVTAGRMQEQYPGPLGLVAAFLTTQLASAELFGTSWSILWYDGDNGTTFTVMHEGQPTESQIANMRLVIVMALERLLASDTVTTTTMFLQGVAEYDAMHRTITKDMIGDLARALDALVAD